MPIASDAIDGAIVELKVAGSTYRKVIYEEIRTSAHPGGREIEPRCHHDRNF
jgi:hypothetical protein